MYKIQCIKTKMYLQDIIDLKNNLCHYGSENDKAIIFENKKAIPNCFKNAKWNLIKINDMKLFKEQTKSTFQISKETNISYSLLRDYCLKNRDSNNMTIGTLKKIAKCLEMTPEELVLQLDK